MSGHERADAQLLREIARTAMLERGFEPDFGPAAERQAAALPGPARPAGVDVRDLRDRPWASIDNDDSRDLDQLTVAEPLADGAARIFIAVADVDALVPRDSPIDRHAAHNTTSVYTPAVIFTMLPERLCYDLTSLNQDEDRLAVVLELTVAADGAVVDDAVYRAWVRNRAKLTYAGVADWLEGEGEMPPAMARVAPVAEQIRLQDRVAQALRQRRHERGALELETIQARAVVRDDQVVALEEERKSRSRELIEDFMIAANGASARFLAAAGFPVVRRVVRAPERWDRIVAVAADYGETLPDAPDAAALEAFLVRRRAADPLRFPDLSLAIIKLIGSGEYVVEWPGQPAAGHFGLAVRDYTHSTAPNRRFPDLITKRLLKAALAGAPVPYGRDELEALARRCTDKEDDAQKVERQVRKAAAASLLAGDVGDEYDAIVTGASDKGVWVRTLHPPVEGKVVEGAAGLDVGERVRVRLVHTDVRRGFIDFARVRR
ncbi:MAG TPA: RNB domain-containing ribonuclease [Chloroflexota bacterium]|nr:RNB domain-containing ribonuclease [Chloroflexota bacterium]